MREVREAGEAWGHFRMNAGAWIWRGRLKSHWESLGFDCGLFDLFIRMKGAKTRLSLLDALSTPRDRLQLAQDLGLDWRAIDYHISLLDRHGLVHEAEAIGRVRMFRRTDLGESLLRLLKEHDGETARTPELATRKSTHDLPHSIG